MAAPKWAPSTYYKTGDIVQPLTALEPITTELDNPGWDLGNLSGWSWINVTGTPTKSVTNLNSHQGVYNLAVDNGVLIGLNDENPPASEGLIINASIQVRLSSSGTSDGQVLLAWYDASDDLIEYSRGNLVKKPGNQSERWVQSNVTGIGPPGTASVKAGFEAEGGVGGGDVRVDTLRWDYTVATPPEGLLFRAVQPAVGTSDVTEPNWPTVNGVQVNDGTVIWEAFVGSRVIYRARPIMRSGPTEPLWPSIPGESIADGTIRWELVVMYVDDPKCPHSKYVTYAKMKIFAGDKDIIAYCATLNARDWSSEKDAGFLGFGIQEGGDNDIRVMNLYRGNVVAMNSAAFQQWQVDPDPELMSLLDDMGGIGSVWHLAAVPVANDMFYLSNLGVRTIGITGSSNNIKAGDVGLPVDTLIQDSVRRMAINPDEQPLGFFFPSSGQYWLVFNLFDVSSGNRRATVWVYTLNQVGQVGAWSRYEFPFAIDYAAQKGDDLYVRDGDTVFRLSESIGTCDYAVFGEDSTIISGVPFDAIIQTPWLDMGPPGVDKDLESYEVIGEGQAEIEIGYSQTQPGYFTDPYLTPADTLPGTPIPMPLSAPSFAVRLTYHGWDPEDPTTEANRYWSFIATILNFVK